MPISPHVLYMFGEPRTFFLNFITGEYQIGLHLKDEREAFAFVPQTTYAFSLYALYRYGYNYSVQSAILLTLTQCRRRTIK